MISARKFLLTAFAAMVAVCLISLLIGYDWQRRDGGKGAIESVALAAAAEKPDPAPGVLTKLEAREVTPDLSQMAAQILSVYANASLGTEVPFVHNGRHYVARIDQLEDSKRGRHKGVTVYAAGK